jgi:hypothetical protein
MKTLLQKNTKAMCPGLAGGATFFLVRHMGKYNVNQRVNMVKTGVLKHANWDTSSLDGSAKRWDILGHMGGGRERRQLEAQIPTFARKK